MTNIKHDIAHFLGVFLCCFVLLAAKNTAQATNAEVVRTLKEADGTIISPNRHQVKNIDGLTINSVIINIKKNLENLGKWNEKFVINAVVKGGRGSNPFILGQKYDEEIPYEKIKAYAKSKIEKALGKAGIYKSKSGKFTLEITITIVHGVWAKIPWLERQVKALYIDTSPKIKSLNSGKIIPIEKYFFAPNFIEKDWKSIAETIDSHTNQLLKLLVATYPLLTKDADVNSKRSKDDVTALIIASQNGHGDIVNALLTKGTDVNAKHSKDGTTALMLASQNGHGDIVETLLSKGADVNAKANNGGTALFMASQNGHGDIVKALLADGADVARKPTWVRRPCLRRLSKVITISWKRYLPKARM